MKSLSISAAALLVLAVVSSSSATVIPIADSGFEAITIPDGSGGPDPNPYSFNNIPGWTVTNSGPFNFIYEPDDSRLEGTGVDNNWLYQGYQPGSISNKQNVTSLANSSIYTLTASVGQDKQSQYPFPSVGNGVSTGNVFARLLVDNSLAQDGSSFVAMPGFVSGNAVSPGGLGNIVNWTLSWTTGSSELLAGKAVYVELASNIASGQEVFWDNVGLTVTPVPEPTSAALWFLGCCGLFVARRGALKGRTRD